MFPAKKHGDPVKVLSVRNRVNFSRRMRDTVASEDRRVSRKLKLLTIGV